MNYLRCICTFYHDTDIFLLPPSHLHLCCTLIIYSEAQFVRKAKTMQQLFPCGPLAALSITFFWPCLPFWCVKDHSCNLWAQLGKLLSLNEKSNFSKILFRVKLKVIIYLPLTLVAALFPFSFLLNPHQDDVCAGVEPISSTTCVLLACLAVEDVNQSNDDIIQNITEFCEVEVCHRLCRNKSGKKKKKVMFDVILCCSCSAFLSSTEKHTLKIWEIYI